jgi:hypothetical protein
LTITFCRARQKILKKPAPAHGAAETKVTEAKKAAEATEARRVTEAKRMAS